ncbi:MAG TPA: reverse transcriptase family protein [Polyangia bacterium]|nr:reverse transcriptase family protein [Polyangia bacterium]
MAFAFLAGSWTESELLTRGREALGSSARGRTRWLRRLVRRVLAAFPVAPIDRDDDLASAIAQDRGLRGMVRRAGTEQAHIHRWLIPNATMVPIDGPPARFPVHLLASSADLAAALGLDHGELAWFSDERQLNARADDVKLSHYHHRWVAKSRGGWRLLEAPKPRLKRIQRWLLDEILAKIPPSDVAHGFVPGRSVRTFVAPHVGRAVVVRIDLEDFFASISRARVAALFRRVGYPRRVAAALAGLCTAPTPERVLAGHPRTDVDLGQRFLVNARLRNAHLPQGAPTSPALSNLAAWRLDRRLSTLAAGFGAAMTRYADDLAFSGDATSGHALRFFVARVGAIAAEQGFRVNHRKTRVMRQGQRQTLCGVVVNDTASLRRPERDRLRAILRNAARFGLDAQNRQGHPDFRRHLEGRVEWAAALNPRVGRRLRDLLARIRP